MKIKRKAFIINGVEMQRIFLVKNDNFEKKISCYVKERHIE